MYTIKYDESKLSMYHVISIDISVAILIALHIECYGKVHFSDPGNQINE